MGKTNKSEKGNSKQVVKTKGGPVTNKRKLEITKELEKLVTDGTILGVTNEQLANKFNTRRQTISDYLKDIYKKIPPEDIKETEVKLKAMFDKIFRFSQQILNQAQTIAEKERAVRLLLTSMKEYTDFLERFGFKQKVADKLDIQHEQVVVNINMDMNEYEQIKELESRRQNV